MFEYFSEICEEESSSFEIRHALHAFYKTPKRIYLNISSVLLKIRNGSSNVLKIEYHFLFYV